MSSAKEKSPSTTDSANFSYSSSSTRTQSTKGRNSNGGSTVRPSHSRGTESERPPSHEVTGVEGKRSATRDSRLSNSAGEHGSTRSPHACKSRSSGSTIRSESKATCSRTTGKRSVSPPSSAGNPEQTCEVTKSSIKERVSTPEPSKSMTATKRQPMADTFSASHPLIPKRYVPPWQLDMKNRELTIENCKKAGLDTWKGHVSHFWQGRERVSVTSHQPYVHLVTGDRDLKRIDSHMSKYNSSMLYFY